MCSSFTDYKEHANQLVEFAVLMGMVDPHPGEMRQEVLEVLLGAGVSVSKSEISLVEPA